MSTNIGSAAWVVAIVAALCVSATTQAPAPTNVTTVRPDASDLDTLYCATAPGTTPKCSQSSTEIASAVAAAYYFVDNTGMDRDGWDHVYFEADRALLASDPQSAFWAVGFAEGMTTQHRMWQYYWDTFPNNGSSQVTDAMQPWIDAHLSYMRNTSGLNAATSQYWAGVQNILAQVDGLAAGYAAAAPASEYLSWFDVFLISYQVELGDVKTAVAVQNLTAHTANHSSAWIDSHCSAFIKVTANDLYMAHDTWDGFNGMLRQYKVYNLTRAVALSGYPGQVHSGDDWYILDNTLTVQETTLEVFNNSIYNAMTPQSVAEFVRVMVANYVATSGSDWTTQFCTENSGTYNNQYMVVNMGLFTPGQALQDGTLWIAEQMPGMCATADVTDTLRNSSYWASYNIPALHSVYRYSGNEAMAQQNGSFFSYHKYARAQIFERNQSQVMTLDDVKALMRYNDYIHDPLSLIPNCTGATGGVCTPPYSPSLAIASRFDYCAADASLANQGQQYQYFSQIPFGAVDCKIAAWSEVGSMTGHIISGPTVQPASGITPFVWSESVFNNVVHLGIPDRMDFQWRSTVGIFKKLTPVAEETSYTWVLAVLAGCIILGVIAYSLVKWRREGKKTSYEEEAKLTGV